MTGKILAKDGLRAGMAACLTLPLLAASPAAPDAGAAMPVSVDQGNTAVMPDTGAPASALVAHYRAYARGLHVANVTVRVAWTKTHYHVQMESRTAGFLQWLRSTWTVSEAEGDWADGSPVPSLFLQTGTVDGRQSVTEILYRQGKPNRIRLGADEVLHAIVSSPIKRTAMDSLSAMVALTREAATTGQCGGSITMFDGGRMESIQSVMAGTEMLPASNTTPVPERVLRCDITGVKQSFGVTPAYNTQPWHGSAWLGPVGSMPVFPIRMRFDSMRSRWMGSITFYLSSLEGIPS